MTSLRFLDTNIPLYFISRDPTESTKHDCAVALIDAGNNALSVQGLGPIRTWLRFKVQEISVPIVTDAWEINATHRLSY